MDDPMDLFKCRAKSAATGKWVYGFPVPFPDGISGWALVGDHFFSADREHIETSEFTEVLNDTIGRFAGFSDYFNTPAFEGDIIFVEPDLYGVIRFGRHAPHISSDAQTGYGFYIEWLGPKADSYRTDIGYWMGADRAVIKGDVFDTPEYVDKLGRVVPDGNGGFRYES